MFTRSFDPDAQILAARGYAVLQPNVRGSSGYGDEFLRGNMNDIGGGDFQDLMTGVEAMIQRGIAHPDSMAVKGWSYGGIPADGPSPAPTSSAPRPSGPAQR